MPVRSLNSSIIKWPSDKQVIFSLEKWVKDILQVNEDIIQIGYFGSYAQGNWGVGSDLDIIIILRQSKLPFEKRNQGWGEQSLPVPTDILIYTQLEWESMKKEKTPFFLRINREVKWVYQKALISDQ